MLVAPVLSSAARSFRRPKPLRTICLVIGSFLLAACGEDLTAPAPVVPRSVATVQIISGDAPNASVTLQRHESRTLLAEARDAHGAPFSEVVFEWTSDDESVAVVNDAGRVLAVASGTTAVTVTAGGRSATVQVTVPPTLVEVRVTPGAAVLTVGTTRQYAARAIDDRGRELSGKAVVWSSSTPAVARISPTGQVTALKAGYATISATVDGLTGSVALTVNATDWTFEENLFSGRVLARSDTSHRTQHGYVVTETRLATATLDLNEETGFWTLSAELVHEDRSYFQGNVIVRQLGRETILDRGSTVSRDVPSGMRLLRSATTGTTSYRLTIGLRHAWMEGRLPGLPVEVAFQLNR